MEFGRQISAVCGTSSIRQQPLQTLWGGYGEIVRLQLTKGLYPSLILKHIQLPCIRGKNAQQRSHKRKVRSYQVEAHWYKAYAHLCDQHCRIAACYWLDDNPQQPCLLLEDLDNAGFTLRKSQLNQADIRGCLQWLAYFHARFLTQPVNGLWKTGCYWHLATRPDEFRQLTHPKLRQLARPIDIALQNARYQTLVHGDAKPDNFCFSAQQSKVAAVDFQYVGNGCGIKDVVYLLDSSLHPEQLACWAEELLHYYFEQLQLAIKHYQIDCDVEALQQEWRQLYPLAWADFYRFLLGWAPGSRIPGYVNHIIQQLAV